MSFLVYLAICVSLSVLMRILTKKINCEIKEMNEQIKLTEKMNKAIERWEKRRYGKGLKFNIYK